MQVADSFVLRDMIAVVVALIVPDGEPEDKTGGVTSEAFLTVTETEVEVA